MKLHTPEIPQFDPTEAIFQWNDAASRARRPFFKATKEGLLQGASVATTESASSALEESQEEEDWGQIGAGGTSYPDSGSDGDSDFDFGFGSGSDSESDNGINDD